MDIRKVELTITLKCGTKVWRKGTIFEAKDGSPIPPEIITEVRQNKRTVKVLDPVPKKEDPIEEISEEERTVTTFFRMKKDELLEILRDQPDFDTFKEEKRPILVKIAIERLMGNGTSSAA